MKWYNKGKGKNFLYNYLQQGQGMVEYALVVAFVVIIAGGFLMGSNPVSVTVLNIFTDLANLL